MKTPISEIRAAIAANVKYLTDFTKNSKTEEESADIEPETEAETNIKEWLTSYSKYVNSKPIPVPSIKFVPHVVSEPKAKSIGMIHTAEVPRSITPEVEFKLETLAKRYINKVFRVPIDDITVLMSESYRVNPYDLRDDMPRNISSYTNAYRIIMDVWKYDEWNTMSFHVSADLSQIVTSPKNRLLV